MAIVEDAAGNVYDDGIVDPGDEQKGFGSGAGSDVVTDPSGVTVGSPGEIDLAPVKGIFGAYKKLFEKIKSGEAGPAEYSAAAGILGLLIPALNKPQTAGWKGSIDMGGQFTRTPVAQPAYTPYAQSQSPVMGQQFFTTSYGPIAAPASAPATSGTTATTTGTTSLTDQGLDPNSPGDSGGRAAGGLLSLARGGEANAPRYLRGKTDGMADKLNTSIDDVQPAKLSHGEFVIPADVVGHFGNGNNEAGAEVLYKMMDRIRKARTGTTKQGKRINPEEFTPGGIAGYAGGGAVAFDAGGAANTDVSMNQEQNISSWAGPYVADMLSKTAALTSSPAPAYRGPITAGTSPLQQKFFTGLQGMDFPTFGQSFSATGAYQLPAAGASGESGAAGPTGIASQYMNPYLSAVLTPQLEEMRRQSEISRKNLGAKFGGAGGAGAFSAMGGGRHAIESSELERNLGQEQSKTIGQAYSTAYDKAMGQFNTEQQRGMDTAKLMAEAGGLQRDIEQQGITGLQKQYETELLQPYTNLRFQREMLSGLPVAAASTGQGVSPLGQLGGQFEKINDLLDALGLLNTD